VIQWAASGIGFVVGLVLGVLIGFTLASSGDSGLKLIAYVVTFVWAIGMTMSTFAVGPEVPPSVHGLLLAIVGAVSGVRVARGHETQA
jgi:uncharacterized protein YacL